MEPYLYIKSPSDNSRIDKQSTSKGNQMKWFENKEFIKKDSFGYESVSEFLAYELIKCSNISEDLIVPYYICDIEHDGKVSRGCFSKDFKKDGEKLITLQRWLEAYGLDLSEFNYSTVSASIKELTYFLGFGSEFLTYMQHMLMLDAVILNEDRHTNNIAFIDNNGVLTPSPYFDHGLSFLSDIKSYPTQYDLRSNINDVKSKPFKESFDLQALALEVGNPLKFDNNKVQNILDTYEDYLGRAGEVLEYQRNRYHKLFV